MSLPELCLGYRGSDSTSVASSLRPTYYMYLSPGVGAFNPEAGGKHTANGESYNAGWRYVGFIHGEGVWSFRLFGNVISSAVLGFGGIFRRTKYLISMVRQLHPQAGHCTAIHRCRLAT